ncbi:nuclear transport factor 2 family protein [Mesonia maritima]|uniref:SnoaL-like domain-containing protein n=1 Tax=Mesonia maritima TaxID=1793873 RepID=A0ABU1K942_9FLAO|nr:nuclear transport factor 2 family protein [Mesonia maritima]MDR6301022.1 hypothetical protein [Mesonia maritima]
MDGKTLVKDFFESEFYANSEEIKNYLHPEVKIFWNSSTGFYKLDFESFKKMSSEMGKSFESLNCDITHLLQEDNNVTIRFSYNVNTIESPDEEIPVAHFIAIWEMKDEKLYKGYIISQPEDDSLENIFSFIPKK